MAPSKDKCPIKGVHYARDFYNKLDRSGDALAGALGLNSSSDMIIKTFQSDPSLSVFNSFCERRKDNFGFDPNSMDPPPKPASFNSIGPKIFDLNTAKWMCIVDNDNPPGLEDKVDDRYIKLSELFRINTIWHAIRLIRVHPDLFPKSEVVTMPYRLAPYDLLHAWKWLVLISNRYIEQKSKSELDFNDREKVDKYIAGLRGKGKVTPPDYVGGNRDESGVNAASGSSQLDIDISTKPTEMAAQIREFRRFFTGHDEQGDLGTNDCVQPGEKPTNDVVNEITVAIGAVIIGAPKAEDIRPPITIAQIELRVQELVDTQEFNKCILYKPENFEKMSVSVKRTANAPENCHSLANRGKSGPLSRR